MTFLEQLIHLPASGMVCADNSDHFPIAEVLSDNSILLTAPDIYSLGNSP